MESRNGFLYEDRRDLHFSKAVHLVWTPKKISGITTLDLFLTQDMEYDPAKRQLVMNLPLQPSHVASTHSLDEPVAELVYASTNGSPENPELISDTESYKLCWTLERRGCKVLSYTETEEGNRLIHATPEIKSRIEPFLTRV